MSNPNDAAPMAAAAAGSTITMDNDDDDDDCVIVETCSSSAVGAASASLLVKHEPVSQLRVKTEAPSVGVATMSGSDTGAIKMKTSAAATAIAATTNNENIKPEPNVPSSSSSSIVQPVKNDRLELEDNGVDVKHEPAPKKARVEAMSTISLDSDDDSVVVLETRPVKAEQPNNTVAVASSSSLQPQQQPQQLVKAEPFRVAAVKTETGRAAVAAVAMEMDSRTEATTTAPVNKPRNASLKRERGQLKDDGNSVDETTMTDTVIVEPELSDMPLQLCVRGHVNSNGIACIRTVAVDERLSKYMKPHQRQGIRFMWKQCFVDFESHPEGLAAPRVDINVHNGCSPAQVAAAAALNPTGGCILAHSMGLGKSFQTIALLHTVMTNKAMMSATGFPLIQTALLVVPKSTITNWQNEFEKWQVMNLASGLIIRNLTAEKSDKRKLMVTKWSRYGGVLLATEGVIKNCLRTDAKKASISTTLLTPDVLILDEAHTLICTETDRNDMLLSIAPRRIIALTGSPFQNNPTEFLQMMKFLRPNVLGEMNDASYFRRVYAKPIAEGMVSDAPKQSVYESLHLAQRLHDFFAPYIQRVGPSVLERDLPPIHHVVLNIRQTRLQTKIYSAHKQSVKDMRKKINFFTYYTMLRPINSHPASLLHRSDSAALRGDDDQEEFDDENGGRWYKSTVEEEGEEKVHAVMNGYKIALLLHLLVMAEMERDKVVVFANSLATLNYIQHVLALDWVEEVPSLAASFPGKRFKSWTETVDYCRIDGGVSATQRGAIIKKFEESKTAKVMLLSKAGGIGINLTSANRVVVLDQHFNPTVVLQAISRVYRYGQKKPVFVYTMLTQGTMEEKVYGRCVNKTGIALRIVEDKTIERCFTAQELADLADNNMWLTCDECGKSRLLADSTGGKIGDKWYCRMNVSDPVNNNCKASEKTQAWYDDREEDKKESAKYGSPMKRDDKILRHILSVTEEDTTLVCDHHFHEILMETATVAEKLEEARQELAASGQVPKPPATTERAILLGGDDENQALAQQCASVMKNASRAGAAPNQANAAMQAMQAFLSVFQSMTNNGASK